MATTPFEAIQPLWNKMPLVSPGSQEIKTADGGAIFADVFHAAVGNVQQSEALANEKMYKMAIGELDNPAEVSIASTKYQMSVDMLIQLRNKSLDAYSELMRISF